MKKLFSITLIILGSMVAAAHGGTIEPSTDIRVKVERSDQTTHLKTEATTRLFYSDENAWADVKLKAKVSATNNRNSAIDLYLPRAIVGYKPALPALWEAYCELGRTAMDDIFESELQYDSMFNGVHLSARRDNILVHGTAHLIDKEKKHYGVVGEVCYSRIGGLPVSALYSITSWLSNSNFLISQAVGKYHIDYFGDVPATCYFGYLRNHKASYNANGYYGGLEIGRIVAKGDWTADINYQHACACCVPAHDFAGIGKGLQVKGSYAVSDHLTMQAKAVFSRSKASRCGEISAIYRW